MKELVAIRLNIVDLSPSEYTSLSGMIIRQRWDLFKSARSKILFSGIEESRVTIKDFENNKKKEITITHKGNIVQSGIPDIVFTEYTSNIYIAGSIYFGAHKDNPPEDGIIRDVEIPSVQYIDAQEKTMLFLNAISSPEHYNYRYQRLSTTTEEEEL